MNCITNAPATSSVTDGEKAHMGIASTAASSAITIERRLPIRSERYPKSVPPIIAPTMENAVKPARPAT